MAATVVETTAAASPPPLSPQATTRDYNKFLVQCLESGDEQRRALLQKFEELKGSLGALGDSRSQLAERTQQLHEVQSLLTEQSLVVQEERERSARLLAENYTLMSELDDCHYKIDALLKMRKAELDAQPDAACPIMVQIPRETRSHVTKQPSSAGCAMGPHFPTPPVPTLSLRSVAFGALDANASKRSKAFSGGGSGNTPSTEDPSGHSSGARTEAHGVPSVNVESRLHSIVSGTPPGSTLVAALSAEVKTYQRLLEEQRVAYERDRGQRVADTRRQEQELHAMLKQHSTTIDSLNEQLHTAVAELCVYRHDTQIAERHLRGEVEILTVRVAEAERLLAAERSCRAADVRSVLDSHAIKAEHVAGSLRSRLLQKEQELRQVQLRHAAELDDLRRSIAAAREAEARERRIRERCESRLHAEVEGRETDIGLLRQQLRSLEKSIYFGHAAAGKTPPHLQEARCARCNAALDDPVAAGSGTGGGTEPMTQLEKERKAAAMIAAIMNTDVSPQRDRSPEA